MHRSLYRRACLAIATAAVMAAGWQVHAETNRVTFPENVNELVHYATVVRGEVTEHIKTTPEAIEAVKNGQPIPEGTHFVLEDFRDGKPYRYFVMQNGPDWGAEYDEGRRTDNWQFQWFWPDKSVNLDENTARCQGCHQGREESDFLYTADRIPEFTGAPVE